MNESDDGNVDDDKVESEVGNLGKVSKNKEGEWFSFSGGGGIELFSHFLGGRGQTVSNKIEGRVDTEETKLWCCGHVMPLGIV